MLQWFKSYLTGRCQRVVLEGAASDRFPVTSGVPQGSILGSIMFLMYIGDLPYTTLKTALYAYDSKLYKSIVFTNSSKLLRDDLRLLHQWTVDWGIPFNVTKCKVLYISRTKSGIINERQYKLEDQPLESVSSYSDLGVLVSNKLAWGNHIEEMISKANKTLGLIKQTCKDLTNPSTRKILYCSLIRYKLEYGSNLLSPHIETLEID